MKKIFVVILILLILSAFADGFNKSNSSNTNDSSNISNSQSSKKTQDTYGFKYAWYCTTKREKTYFLYNPDKNLLVEFTYRGSKQPSSKYYSYNTEGDLTSGLYTLDSNTGEPRSEYYIKTKNGYEIIYGDYSTSCTSCAVSSTVKLLVNDFGYIP